MKRFLYTLAQITWGFPQTCIGAVLFLVFARCPHFLFHGAVCTIWPAASSVSLGMFTFVARDPRKTMVVGSAKNGAAAQGAPQMRTLPVDARLVVHEYGHTIQSIIFGPLYLVLFGIPSFIWAMAPALRRRRTRRGTSYYSLYTERLANYLGEKVTKQPAMRY